MMYAATSNSRANVESGQGGPAFDLGNLTDTIETTMNQITEQAANVDADTAGAMVDAVGSAANAVNPLNNDNIIAGGVNAVGGAIAGFFAGLFAKRLMRL